MTTPFVLDPRAARAAADIARAVVIASEALPADDRLRLCRAACPAIAVQDLHPHVTTPTR
ncbi:hypothetical protein [Streptomyces niveus]|uniref:hypothetical protein n=1 Tax=Streptomyces niveus TaxID=193462 RepID=UPI0013315D9E|nr:hypothetical protein [Streptomyces niveus]